VRPPTSGRAAAGVHAGVEQRERAGAVDLLVHVGQHRAGDGHVALDQARGEARQREQR